MNRTRTVCFPVLATKVKSGPFGALVLTGWYHYVIILCFVFVLFAFRCITNPCVSWLSTWVKHNYVITVYFEWRRYVEIERSWTQTQRKAFFSELKAYQVWSIIVIAYISTSVDYQVQKTFLSAPLNPLAFGACRKEFRACWWWGACISPCAGAQTLGIGIEADFGKERSFYNRFKTAWQWDCWVWPNYYICGHVIPCHIICLMWSRDTLSNHIFDVVTWFLVKFRLKVHSSHVLEWNVQRFYSSKCVKEYGLTSILALFKASHTEPVETRLFL